MVVSHKTCSCRIRIVFLRSVFNACLPGQYKTIVQGLYREMYRLFCNTSSWIYSRSYPRPESSHNYVWDTRSFIHTKYTHTAHTYTHIYLYTTLRLCIFFMLLNMSSDFNPIRYFFLFLGKSLCHRRVCWYE